MSAPITCRLCDISTADCPARPDNGYEPEDGITEDF